MNWREREEKRLVAELMVSPNYDTEVHDPFLLKDMDKAVARILTAIKKKEKIMIFGDYDADGVPATALLSTIFNWIGGVDPAKGGVDYSIYIPDRHNEAFGLSNEAIKKFAEQKVKLLITVDCGITDDEEVALANDLGMEVIITDHHLAPEKLPQALAIVDPKRTDCNYPYKSLCGTGVAYKLAQALLQKGKFENINDGREKWLLDLVALATVSDMVPITGENKTLAHFGLMVLQKTRRPGLLALCRVLKLDPRYITEDDIGFSLGPRINSASRMSHASEAYELLMSEDPTKADAIATILESRNVERRSSVDVILKQAEDLLGVPEDFKDAVLVVGREDFSLGVLGLTASRLVEKYHKPVFVWGVNGVGEVKGSCRSDGTINMVELMKAVKPGFFADFGGHVMAGGFSLPLGKEGELSDRLNKAFVDAEKASVEREIVYDGELNIDEVTNETYNFIRQFGPFGIENEKPLFLFKDLLVSESKMFGNGGLHLELKFKNTVGKSIPAIGFFFNKDMVFVPGDKVSFLASVEKSYFRRFPELRLRLVDIKKAE
ncbi:MAG: single-stranded-DNA-specific exonuclease RecJ [Candidatus Pacebacteria bacterium]|nr:single-stranded-DNA-specific exonuclease RecJ [Candidatus Paceibacterota bacterium]